jgi:hypothetical protein
VPPNEESLSDILQKTGYFDAAGNLRIEFVVRERIAPLVEDMSRAKPPLTMHQVRRFFQHCRAIEARLKARSSTWAAEEAGFLLLDAAAADAFRKSPPKIPEAFHEFLRLNVAAVRSEKDFLKGFLPHFEALVGFGTAYLKDRERS